MDQVCQTFSAFCTFKGDKSHRYRLLSEVFPRLLRCSELRKAMGVTLEDTVVKLDVLCGIDAPPIFHQPTVIPKNATHLSFTLLQYGEVSRSPWMRHLLALDAGKDSTSEMRQYLATVMADVFPFKGNGRELDLGQWRPVVVCVPHMSADLACLFSLGGLQSFTNVRICYKCMAKPDSCCCMHPLLIPECFVFPFHPLNIHTDFPLHFGTNLTIRLIRVAEGEACTAGGQTEDDFYEAFRKPVLYSIGVRHDEVTTLHVLERHVEAVRDVLPALLSDPAYSTALGKAVQAFCILTPLMSKFFLKEWELEELIAAGREFAHNFRKLHPTPEKMFPYWHQIDAELERSARYLFTFCGGVGPGAVGCQGVESLGHILKVLAHHSGYDPEKFLFKLAEQHEFRFAEHHGVLELLSSSDVCEEDVGEETEESQSKKGTRKRAHS